MTLFEGNVKKLTIFFFRSHIGPRNFILMLKCTHPEIIDHNINSRNVSHIDEWKLTHVSQLHDREMRVCADFSSIYAENRWTVLRRPGQVDSEASANVSRSVRTNALKHGQCVSRVCTKDERARAPTCTRPQMILSVCGGRHAGSPKSARGSKPCVISGYREFLHQSSLVASLRSRQTSMQPRCSLSLSGTVTSTTPLSIVEENVGRLMTLRASVWTNDVYFRFNYRGDDISISLIDRTRMQKIEW